MEVLPERTGTWGWLLSGRSGVQPAAEGMGRELFGLFRGAADEAELGASAIFAGAGL